MFNNTKRSKSDFTIIKMANKNRSNPISFLDDVSLTKHKRGERKLTFSEISNYSPSEISEKWNLTTFIHENYEYIIIKELNFNFFYSKRYVEQLVSNYPDSKIAMVSIYHTSDQNYGSELKIIVQSKPTLWIRSFDNQQMFTDFGTNYINNLNHIRPTIGDKKEINNYIEFILQSEFGIIEMENLIFQEINRCDLEELIELNFISSKELLAIDKTIASLSSSKLYSSQGWLMLYSDGMKEKKAIPIKDLAKQSMIFLKELLNIEGYKYLKSKNQFKKPTKSGANIIQLGTHGYSLYSEFHILVIKRNDEIAKEMTKFVNKKENNKSNYKNQWTISTDTSDILLGNVVAFTMNSLVSQLISLSRLINSFLIPTLEGLENIEEIDNCYNNQYDLQSINYWSYNYPFSRTTNKTRIHVCSAIINKNPRTQDILKKAVSESHKPSLQKELFQHFKSKYWI